jgi:hypothetical protein
VTSDAILLKAIIALVGKKFLTSNPSFKVRDKVSFDSISKDHYIFFINGVEVWFLRENIDNIGDLDPIDKSTRKKYRDNI